MHVAVSAGEARAADRTPGPHRILVVGGGAGGLELATRLGDKLGRRGKADVTLIDKARVHLWKPLLHEIAAGRWILVIMSSITSRRHTGTIFITAPER